MIPIEDLTGVTLAIDDTEEDEEDDKAPGQKVVKSHRLHFLTYFVVVSVFV